MKSWIVRHKIYLAGGLLGAVTGFLYWKYWGCVDGCAITSSPRNSTIYFAILGAMLFGLFTKEKNETS